MANLTGTAQAFHSDTAAVDSTQSGELGRRAWDADGNEYAYLKGTASMTAGSWANYDNNCNVELLAGNAVGPVGIAMAAITATTTAPRPVALKRSVGGRQKGHEERQRNLASRTATGARHPPRI